MVPSMQSKIFSLKKERNSDTCCNIDKAGGHYAQWNKPATKGQRLYDSIHDVSKVVKLIGTGNRERGAKNCGEEEIMFSVYRVSIL